MNSRKYSHLHLMAPLDIRFIIMSKNKKSTKENSVKKSKPYYMKPFLHNEDSEPLIERDFEG